MFQCVLICFFKCVLIVFFVFGAIGGNLGEPLGFDVFQCVLVCLGQLGSNWGNPRGGFHYLGFKFVCENPFK